MNKVILKGNVGQDPKITNFDNGGRVAQFTLATTERGFTTRDGKEIPDVTDWHNIVVKNPGLAGVCEQYVKKGTPLLIVGKIRTREYQDNSGQTRYITEIIVDELELLGGQKREQAPAPTPDYSGGLYTPGNDMPDNI
jgi:single-strand DNA-binding protein